MDIPLEPTEQDAQSMVERFVRRFDDPDSYRMLACHVALPLIITPELVHYLRNTFLRGQVPWVAEADLLLSDLCRPVGYEQYAMDSAVRAYLMRELRERFGEAHIQQVARLLIGYVHYLSQSGPRFSQHELQAQQWAAMVCLDDQREQAVGELADLLKRNIEAQANSHATGHQAEVSRLSRLIQELSPQLESHAELVEYAELVGRMLADPARTLAEEGEQARQARRVAGVELPPVAGVGAREPQPEQAKGTKRPGDFFTIGGSVFAGNGVYVVRSADRELVECILKGRVCYLQATRQMGKSSVAVRAALELEKYGAHVTFIDFSTIGAQVEEDAWFFTLISEIHEQIELTIDIEKWWLEYGTLTPPQRFIRFLEDIVLEETTGQVVLFLDEIDCIYSMDFNDDFFSLIRAIHNKRAINKNYARLSFVLLGIDHPSKLIQSKELSPFNIGEYIVLQDFTLEEAAVLRDGLEHFYPGQGSAFLKRIFYWTDGHPYLTQRLCHRIAETPNIRSVQDIDRLVEEEFFSIERQRDVNFQFVHRWIERSKEQRKIYKLYQRVYRGESIERSSPLLEELLAVGLVKLVDDKPVVRNRIYRRVFNEEWIKENLPSFWQR